jgi:hypothetical protein
MDSNNGRNAIDAEVNAICEEEFRISELTRDEILTNESIKRLFKDVRKAGHEPHRMGTISIYKRRTTENGMVVSAQCPIRTRICSVVNEKEMLG